MSDEPDFETLPDTDEIVERVIESVLDQVPDLPDSSIPEASERAQPWADIAAPPGKNKRPLEELLAEYRARVAADPDAKAGAPNEKTAQELFFERLTAPAPSTSKRRRRRRPRGKTPASETPASTSQNPAPSGATPSGDPNRRRRRRGRRGGRSRSGSGNPPTS